VTIGGLSNNVSVIDTATNTVVATVPVGNGPGIPFGVAITPRLVTFACPLGQGFWKNHSDAWPVTSLTLGSQTYTQAELLALFDTPPGGDASVILAHQLIATKLSIANGSNPAPISSTIADADNLLSQFSSTLPYNVGTSSDIGQQMVNDANGLDRYNNGELMPDCRPQGVPNSSGSDLQGTNMEITRKLLGGVAAGAACMPEWRAARLDPIVALRRD
jgi:YVTN family beta-propeller protein